MTGTASFDFTGKNVFVVGGTSGINLGIAEAFSRAGARMGVASRKQDKVDAAVEKLSNDAGKALGYAFDVRSFEDVSAALNDFAEKAGKIDVLISGAAGNFPAPAVAISPNGFKSVIDIDLMGTFHVMRAAHPNMARPGSLINISAPQAVQAMPFQVHVCAAKAGVDMITKCLAIEWGPDNLRVNSVIPGPIDGTEGMDRLAPTEKMREKVIQSVPMKRMGDPEDVALACLYLASDAGRYVNGQILAADGGWVAGGVQLPM
ncbi:SDR family oxidoreductase [Shimia ponticola]|uniref:SDR family oxidoreductase n=1 Tax=Shimia ponticola TaxID=2582893 RepID=UPI0011BDFAE4|nr:SDR family oxidoreductase [Shimia ponticola]